MSNNSTKNWRRSMATSQKQISQVRTELEASCMTQFDGPNGSLMEIYTTGSGGLFMCQIWPDAGWDYYVQGREGKSEKVAENIRSILGQ